MAATAQCTGGRPRRRHRGGLHPARLAGGVAGVGRKNARTDGSTTPRSVRAGVLGVGSAAAYAAAAPLPTPFRPEPARPMPADPTLPHETVLARAREELSLKTGLHDRLFGLAEADWAADLAAGTLTFTSAAKGVTATCDCQVVGTLNTDDGTWLWGWDHPSVPPGLDRHAAAVKAYGEAKGLPDLTTRKLEASEDDGWTFAALACHLSDAQGAYSDTQGAYRGPAGPARVFFTYGEPRITKLDGSGVEDEADDEEVEPGWDEEDAGDATPVPEKELSADVPADVRAFFDGFLADWYAWETEAFAGGEATRDDEAAHKTAWEVAEAAHTALIRKWGVPGAKRQGVSYGSHPDHDPKIEHPVGVASDPEHSSDADALAVRTESTDSTGDITLYEYRLRRAPAGWRVARLLFVEDTEEAAWDCL